ncbi:MAG: hypothetical protein HPY79_06395 [Bacteroidales bacterium]|nr:hypothetical protein [Bacteroidales bacterium]
MKNFKLFKVKTIENSWLIGVKGKLFDTKGFFIIDTGAQVSMINRSYCKTEKNIDIQEVEVMGISTNTLENVELAKRIPIKLTQHNYTLKKALIMDINHVTEKFKSNYTILGLIGNDFLHENIATLDYYYMEMNLRLDDDNKVGYII